MATYRILLAGRARKALEKIGDKKTLRKIARAIERLAENPRPDGVKKLKTENCYRVRVGDYRIVNDIHDKELHIHVVNIGHRREIYRK